jgi:hypothetical protein
MFHSSTGELLWSVNQITDPALSVTGETAQAVDAIGTTIMEFDRSKAAEFSASNSIFDLGLFAAQSGTNKVESSALVKVTVPQFEEVTKDATGEVTLKHVPNAAAAAGIPYIYTLNGDGTTGAKYSYAAIEGANAFAFLEDVLTFPTSPAEGTRFLVIYEYDADEVSQAVTVKSTANDFPTGGKFVLEVLGADVCDSTTKYYAYLIFPQAKLTSSFDVTFATDWQLYDYNGHTNLLNVA